MVEEDRPEPQPGEVRVKVLAAGVSAYDLMLRRSGIIPGTPRVPFTPGVDIVGLADELGELERHAALLLDDLWPWAELLDEELCRWRGAKPARYPVSTGFAHRLLGYAEMARVWEQEERISAEDMLYLARLAYDLGRNVVKSDAVPEETKRQLSRLTQLASKEVMALMRLPITYALYRNRERSRER